MIDLKDLVKPPVLLAMTGSAAVGFAAGFLLGRDPQLLRRVLAAAAQSWEQTRLTVAETREELVDQWAEAREQARQDAEEAAFAAATAAVVTPEPTPAPQAAAAPVPARARKAKRASRATTRGGGTRA
jgi:hypothetical protein